MILSNTVNKIKLINVRNKDESKETQMNAL